MAANRQQGAYLATSLAGFTALTAGLVSHATHAVLGSIATLAGAVLFAYSLFGFYRIKKLELTKES